MKTAFDFRYNSICALALAAISVTACSDSRETFGLGKAGPDEFEVLTRAPLSIPPDYRLRTPVPGLKRPQETSAQTAARQILLQSSGSVSAGPGDSSAGETALLRKAGASKADPGIRDRIDRENQLLGGKNAGLVDILLFWREVETKSSQVDAEKEARRLRENAALGDPPTKGRTPTIEREGGGLFD